MGVSKELKIGFLGPKMTFSHQAALKRAGKRMCQEIEYFSFRKIIKAVKTGEIDEGIVPVENLMKGAIADVLDAIIAENKVEIIGELVLPINLNLVGVEMISLLQIKKVVSKAEVFPQCDKWLVNNLPDVEIAEAVSTASAIENLAEYEYGTAAIGSAFAADFYGMRVIVPKIQDEKSNATHFLVLGKNSKENIGEHNKTSLVFSIPNRPGALVDVLSVFSSRHVNLLKIESRPSKKKLQEYIFWVDVDGHQIDDLIKEALGEVENMVKFLHVLGSYPKETT